MMLRVFIISLVVCLSPLISQAQTIRDVFKAMPDSLTPYLSANNRLDMMDFMDAKMKAVVTNELDGESEMLFLSDDSLSIKMSEALLMEMRAFCEGTDTIVCVRQDFHTSDGRQETMVRRFHFPSWTMVSSTVDESTLFRRDEELKDKKPFLY